MTMTTVHEAIGLTGVAVAIITSAIAYYRTNTIKILREENSVYKEQNNRLYAENSDYRDRLTKMETKLETLERVLQGRDPTTEKTMRKLADSMEQFAASFVRHAEDDAKQFAHIAESLELTAKHLQRIEDVYLSAKK